MVSGNRQLLVPAVQRRAGWLLWLALLTWADPAAALTEDEAKAAFVFNFAKFADWPPAAFANAMAPLRVCLLNPSAQQAAAFAALEGKQAKGCDMRILRVSRPEDLLACHIAYLPAQGPAQAAETVRITRARPVLTIGDVAGVAEVGTIIALVPVDSRLQIVVNVDELSASQLNLSSQVLKLAKILKREAR